MGQCQLSASFLPRLAGVKKAAKGAHKAKETQERIAARAATQTPVSAYELENLVTAKEKFWAAEAEGEKQVKALFAKAEAEGEPETAAEEAAP